MTYQIYTQPKRLEYIQKNGLTTKILESDLGADTLKVEIEIKDNYELVKLFHAGIEYGMDVIYPIKK